MKAVEVRKARRPSHREERNAVCVFPVEDTRAISTVTASAFCKSSGAIDLRGLSSAGNLLRVRKLYPPFTESFKTFLVSKRTFLVSTATYLVSKPTFLVSSATYLVSSLTFLVSSATYPVSSATYPVSKRTFLVSTATFLESSRTFSHRQTAKIAFPPVFTALWRFSG